MGVSSSQHRSGRRPDEHSSVSSAPANMPPHLASQYQNRRHNAASGPGNSVPFNRQRHQHQHQHQHQQQSASMPPAAPPPQQQHQANEGSSDAAMSNPASQRVQEGQIVKMLATVDAASVKYDSVSCLLRFSITSTCQTLTYEVHTGVKEFIKGGNVSYMPNKPKMEPQRITLEGPLEKKNMVVHIDTSQLEEKERVYNKHYPKQQPCVVVLRYQTREMRRADDKPNEPAREVNAEQTEHTAIDLADNPKRRVISQVVTAGGCAYVVENLFGVEGEAAAAGGAEVTIGDTIVSHDSDDDDDGLCVICLTVPKDTAVMPCRHMCLCKECAKELVCQSPKCPVCRGPVSTLLHMPVVKAYANSAV